MTDKCPKCGTWAAGVREAAELGFFMFFSLLAVFLVSLIAFGAMRLIAALGIGVLS